MTPTNHVFFTVAVLDVITEARAAQMRALLPDGFRLTHAKAQGEAAMQDLIKDADFAIAGQVGVSAAVLQAGQRLKLLHKWGVGVDNLDLDAARALGVRVARTTGSNALPVAEFTIGLMLSALRCLSHGHAELKQGHWRGPGQTPTSTMLLSGKTVGIVGMGAIGRQVAALLAGFGCRILYTKRERLSAADEARLSAHFVDLDTLLAQSDVITLHCPLTAETANLIHAGALARMKPSAVLINAARGGIVVEADLITALKTRTIQAAAMDVFAVEPLPADSPLLGLDNLVVTPHLAASSADTFEPTVRRMYENMRRLAHGEEISQGDIVI